MAKLTFLFLRVVINTKVTFDKSTLELILIAETQEDRDVLLAFHESDIDYLNVAEMETATNCAIKFTPMTARFEYP